MTIQSKVYDTLKKYGPHRMIDLIDEVFGDEQPANADASIRSQIHRLRAKLPPNEAIIRTGERQAAIWHLEIDGKIAGDDGSIPVTYVAAKPRFYGNTQPRWGR